MDEAEAQQKARSFIAGKDISNIQNDLSVYVLGANAKLKKDALDEGESGYTITKNDHHIITVNSNESEQRQRFTVCHEIAHIILNLPSNHQVIPSWSYAKKDLNEVLCDIFAAELLMPYKMFIEKIPKQDPSYEVVDYMATEFKTSFPATASRYATLVNIPCAFVTMQGNKIRYAARSTALRRLNAWIPPKSIMPIGSVAYRLKETASDDFETEEVSQDIWFENWEKGLDLWEISRHYVLFDTTVSLLWFSGEDFPITEVDRFGMKQKDDGGLAELTGELPWPGKSRRR